VWEVVAGRARASRGEPSAAGAIKKRPAAPGHLLLDRLPACPIASGGNAVRSLCPLALGVAPRPRAVAPFFRGRNDHRARLGMLIGCLHRSCDAFRDITFFFQMAFSFPPHSDESPIYG
jgi:hypothetical protein